MCFNKTHTIKIDTTITAHKNLKYNTIANISFFIKVKKVNEVYIYYYGLLQRRNY
jgi:hypothetical protein